MKSYAWKKAKAVSTIMYALIVLLAAGCEQPADIVDVSASPTEEQPSPTDDWIFGDVSDNGDIEINSSVLADIKTKVYEFSEAPTILIYHTHATEAFLQTEDYTYTETGEWRTDDNEKNVVHLGEVLKTQLEELGFNVIHDTTNVEPPELTSAYSRSLEVMKKYPEADIYIDLHRNAADVERVRDNTAFVDGNDCAKVFFVVGTGVGTYEGEYDVAPDWESNYAFALSVQKKISKYAPGIMKAIRTKVGRYNQHMGMCLLIEVGNNANTMEEELNSLPYLAKALGEVLVF